MRKLQLWSTIKDLLRCIDDWDEEKCAIELSKPEIVFHKYLPTTGRWDTMQKYTIRIRIETQTNEKENSTREGAQSVEKS